MFILLCLDVSAFDFNVNDDEPKTLNLELAVKSCLLCLRRHLVTLALYQIEVSGM